MNLFIMQNFRHKVFYKHCYPQHRVLLEQVKKVYNNQQKEVKIKNFHIFKKDNSKTIFIEKKLGLYDRHGYEVFPCELFIDLPKLYNLNLPVMSHCGYQTSLYKALFYNRKYNIIPYKVKENQEDEDLLDEKNPYPISITIPEKYKDECIYTEKGDELILSRVKVYCTNNINDLICRITVDPLFFEEKTFIC